MQTLNKHVGLFIDYYELTMAQGYLLGGKEDCRVTFDYFYRKNPYGGGYTLFVGLEDILELILNFRFEKEDLNYLNKAGFDKRFLEYLTDFRFRSDIWSCKEGEVVFPNEPILRVEGNIIEAQLIETILLNFLNFETLIATKATRIRQIAGDKTITDFGLRRAQGLGGIHASRAAIIGGFDSTSNVYSAFSFGLPSSGTQAHSWVQSFENELEAFRSFARIYPDDCVLLVDTYATLNVGIPNAIRVGKEMEAEGNRLKGIRLDSGDLAYLSKKARQMLDNAGLKYVKIFVSNQLDEYLIKSLKTQGACIDVYGVGTKLITGKDDAALDGVYKLSESDGKPKMKTTDSYEKMTLPGRKKIFRILNGDGMFFADAITLVEEMDIGLIQHPFISRKHMDVSHMKKEELLIKVLDSGKRTTVSRKPGEIAQYAQERLNQVPEEHKRFENPHAYKIGISEKLLILRDKIVNSTNQKNG
jgi:nicotinate phosphoribosyltransferase